MEKILILGMGGHAKSVTDVIERENKYEIAGYIVNDCNDMQVESKYPILGNDDKLHELFLQGIQNAAIGIGYLGNSGLRTILYKKLKEIGYNLPVLSDPSAVIAAGVFVEEGTFIGKSAVINADAEIGKMCIINTGAIVEHDCHVGDFSHVSVGTVLCGGVNIGTSVFIGANATVIQGISIGNRTIIGAGEVLKKDLGDNTVYCN